jgi:diacylglycerol kinase (ATP)
MRPLQRNTPPRPIHLLVNPAAGSGRAQQRVQQAYAALRTIGPVELVESEGPRDEIRLATQAAQANARVLVVLGGDGSVSHAARGLIAARTATPLAIFAAGTGNDFAKSLGTPSRDFLAMTRCIASGSTRSIDAGEIDGIPFVNAAGFGFDVEVLLQSRAAKHRQLLRGTTQYAATALRQLFQYRGFDASVSALRGGDAAHWLTVVFANGQWFGGAFRIAPVAELGNGLLDVVGIADASPWQRARLFGRALRGTHVDHEAVVSSRTAECVIRFDTRAHFQADGEAHHASDRTVRVRCLPNALRVVTLS